MGGIPETAELVVAAAPPRSWTQRVLVLLCMSLLLAGLAGLVVVNGDDDSDPGTPAEELARAQAFVQRARTAHFVGDQETVSKTGDRGLGSTFTDRSRAEGVFEVPYRSRWIEDAGEYVMESVVVEHGSYFREAEDRGALAREQWTYTPDASQGDSVDDVEDVELAGPSLVANAFDATDLADLFRAAQNPTPVRPGVVKATLDVGKLAGAEEFFADAEIPLPKITVEVHSEADGRLTRLVLESEMTMPAFDDEEESGGGDEVSVTRSDVRFTRWGEPVEIAAPPASEVDPTPGVAEDDIAAFTEAPLLAPRTLPAGFELVSAEVFTEETDEEFEECAEVMLEYGRGADMDAYYEDPDVDAEYPPTLDISIVPASCEFAYELEGDPIRLGRHSGVILRGDAGDEEYGTTIEVVIGGSRVTIESDLPEKVVVAAASDLVPLDLGAQPVHRVEPPQ